MPQSDPCPVAREVAWNGSEPVYNRHHEWRATLIPSVLSVSYSAYCVWCLEFVKGEPGL